MKFLVALAALTGASASYVATLSHIAEDTLAPKATGYVYFDGVDSNGIVTGFSQANHLEANVDSTNGVDCTAANGCGMHIHEGDACTNTTTQGGHYFEGDEDPWATVGYTSTDVNGYSGMIDLKVDMGSLPIEGKPFIVHANDGSRIACGIIESTTLSHEEVAFLN
eukprot:CAMPEP_0119529680 /NCGR_PEP_ID=MMETSP1344-20130328/43646_1 /TAXON_ID=236787 /ORGANISM="Florenciella parvula, Strain CCMP2471" /LENGTH=165 /DNA_ID=CAMNT_0007569375 /DNA_START=148 /DNA_END=645 /DNA_ORIENTATION=-